MIGETVHFVYDHVNDETPDPRCRAAIVTYSHNDSVVDLVSFGLATHYDMGIDALIVPAIARAGVFYSPTKEQGTYHLRSECDK